MPRTKPQLTNTRGVRAVRDSVTVRDQVGVAGRALVEAGTNGKVWVYLQQTYSGSSEGTLKELVKCDLDVLLAICAEAEAIAEGAL